MSSPESPKSEFNMAVAWLNRLNYWFYSCDDASSRLNAHEWLQNLMILLRELSTEIDPKEMQTKQQEAKLLFEEIIQWDKIEIKKGRMSISPDTYWKLHELEVYLRKKMDKSGLLKKVMSDAAKALG